MEAREQSEASVANATLGVGTELEVAAIAEAEAEAKVLADKKDQVRSAVGNAQVALIMDATGRTAEGNFANPNELLENMTVLAHFLDAEKPEAKLGDLHGSPETRSRLTVAAGILKLIITDGLNPEEAADEVAGARDVSELSGDEWWCLTAYAAVWDREALGHAGQDERRARQTALVSEDPGFATHS